MVAPSSQYVRSHRVSFGPELPLGLKSGSGVQHEHLPSASVTAVHFSHLAPASLASLASPLGAHNEAPGTGRPPRQSPDGKGDVCEAQQSSEGIKGVLVLTSKASSCSSETLAKVLLATSSGSQKPDSQKPDSRMVSNMVHRANSQDGGVQIEHRARLRQLLRQR